MLLGIIGGLAFALPPNHLAPLKPILGAESDGGQIERMAISYDQRVVVGRERGQKVGWVLSLEDWSVRLIDDCGVTGITTAQRGDRDTLDIWVSCDDGFVRGYDYDPDTFELTASTWDIGSGDEDAVLQLDDELYGIWTSYDDYGELLYAVGKGADNELTTLHVFDTDGLVDASIFSGYPAFLTSTGFDEGVVSADYLVVSHSGSDITGVQLNVDVPLITLPIGVTNYNCTDIAESYDGVYCVTQSGQLVEYLPRAATFQVLGLGSLPSPNAVVASFETGDEWLAVTGEQVSVWLMENASIPSVDPYFQGPENADNQIQDMVTANGYLFGGGVAGNLHVVTARPWVYPGSTTATSGTLTSGDVVTVTSKIDMDSDWVVRRGGSYQDPGDTLASGTAGEDEDFTTEVTVDASWDEGTNRIYVVGTNNVNLEGHASTTVFVDNPPKPPALTAANVGFADGALDLSFPGIDDADLDFYEVYVTATPFTAGEYSEGGGPEFDGPDDLETPIVINADPEESIELRITPLTNGATYYIGVRATDTGGKVGPMSKVVSGTPRPVFTAAELAGEKGGTPCSTGPVPSASWLLLGLPLLLRRRGLASALVVGLGLTMAGDAMAAEDEKPNLLKQDLSPSRGDFEIRYGVITLGDDNINSVYNEGATNLLQTEFGPQFWRVAEIDLGIGFFQELASSVDASGLPSSEKTMLTWYPFSLDGTLRLHILDEQPLVPFARAGWDYIIWSEKNDDGLGGKETIRGGKFGVHWGYGINLLLDTFAPHRASLLEAQTGINDSFLTLEWRRQVVDGRDRPWDGPTQKGLDFSGDAITLGLKLDY